MTTDLSADLNVFFESSQSLLHDLIFSSELKQNFLNYTTLTISNETSFFVLVF